MHGRVKIRTSAEQAEARRRELSKKLKMYRQLMTEIYDLVDNDPLSEVILNKTYTILSENSDFSTLWNLRKNVLSSLNENLQEEEMSKYVDSEKSFVLKCLKENPKSYSLWLHRQFLVSLRPDLTSVSSELELCGRLLDMDERNFHCWDYRRWLVARDHSTVTNEDELQFTVTKLSSNFSNFSSWHYRSKLLEITSKNLEAHVLTEELGLVRNALYTDPYDQSGWLYYHWLLTPHLQNSETKFEICYLSRKLQQIILVFPSPMMQETLNALSVKICGSLSRGVWNTPISYSNASKLWTFSFISTSLPPVGSVTIDISGDITVSLTLESDSEKLLLTNEGDYKIQDVLSNEIQMLEELQEVEPENKWIIYTMIVFLALANLSDNFEQIESLMRKLKGIDPKRNGFYSDWHTKLKLKNGLLNNSHSLDLSHSDISRLLYSELCCVVETCSLSNNNIRRLNGIQLFICLKEINVDNNQIKSVEPLSQCRFLRKCSAENNFISSLNDVMTLQECRLLKYLNLKNNPVIIELNTITDARDFFPIIDQFNDVTYE